MVDVRIKKLRSKKTGNEFIAVIEKDSIGNERFVTLNSDMIMWFLQHANEAIEITSEI